MGLTRRGEAVVTKADDWTYTRTRSQHFDAGELALIAKRFREGASPIDVARELRCSSRVIYTRFRQLRGGEPVRRKAPKPETLARPKSPPVNRESRFYRSNFEPS